MTPEQHSNEEQAERRELDSLVSVLGNSPAQGLAAIDALDYLIREVEREHGREMR